MIQAAQILGVLLLLAGFVAAQAGAISGFSRGYLTVNAVGAGLLATVATAGADWGFLILAGVWAAVSAGRLTRVARPDLVLSRRRVRMRARRLPSARAVAFAGDELSSRSRLTRLFRDSYLGAQGRQWLQPLILWWELLVLRENGIRVNRVLLDEAVTADSIANMGLPAGHVTVRPAGQVETNFRFWWAMLAKLTALAYRRRACPGGAPLPDTGQVRDLAEELGLRPWMSSATREETAGIGDALTQIRDHRRLGSDEFMVRVLLPGLLLVELHWLHVDGGRPGRDPIDLVLPRRYTAAAHKAAAGRYLTPLELMYARAGDILDHVQSLPAGSLDPVLRHVVELAEELRVAHDRASGELRNPQASGGPDRDRAEQRNAT